MSTPTKEQTRKWLLNRSVAKTPPPSPEQIRKELGWDLVKNNNQLKGKR